MRSLTDAVITTPGLASGTWMKIRTLALRVDYDPDPTEGTVLLYKIGTRIASYHLDRQHPRPALLETLTHNYPNHPGLTCCHHASPLRTQISLTFVIARFAVRCDPNSSSVSNCSMLVFAVSVGLVLFAGMMSGLTLGCAPVSVPPIRWDVRGIMLCTTLTTHTAYMQRLSTLMTPAPGPPLCCRPW